MIGKYLRERGSELVGADLHGQHTITLPDGFEIQLDENDLDIRLHAKDGYTASQGSVGVLVLNTELSPELVAEGLAQLALLLQYAVQTLGLAVLVTVILLSHADSQP